MKNYIQKIKKIKTQFGKFNTSEVENVLNVLSNDKIDYVKKLETLFCKKFKVSNFIFSSSCTVWQAVLPRQGCWDEYLRST